MTADRQPEDLAATLAGITRRLAAAEEPLLAARDITMWDYIVMSALATQSAPNQLTLARQVRHDKSRLIPLLDGLESRGLIQRDRDPTDRRSHTVSLTEAGQQLLHSARSAIREMEKDFLSVLTATERRTLLTALPKLSAADLGAT